MFYSPLRYPGGKGKILSFMKELVEQNNLQDIEYVEPYAGGSAVALGLLIDGYVSKIHINDFDPAINAFWESVLNDTDKFIAKIRRTNIDIQEWEKQRKIYSRCDASNLLKLGFSAFYLNRCNYSGVIKGGPIGGLKQEGKWKLDARFNKKELIERIKRIGEYRDKIHIYNEDSYELLNNNKKQFENAILYLDPPYFVKGRQLYKNHYNYESHEKIANLVKELKGHWIVTYDNVEPINGLYAFAKRQEFEIKYSAGKTRKGDEIMFFSDNLIIPNRKIC